MNEDRRYIRHPADIPIEVRGGPGGGAAGGKTHNVSLGGLAIEVDGCLDAGAIVEVHLPTTRPPFQTRGKVVWCRQVDGSYEMGVQFLDPGEAFRARMVEQVCHIQQYQNEVREAEGRELSDQDAAREWIRKHAATFPNPARE